MTHPVIILLSFSYNNILTETNYYGTTGEFCMEMEEFVKNGE